MPSSNRVAFLLIKYAATRMHSPQKVRGTCAWNLKARATSKRCQCFRSTTPFCWAMATQLLSWRMHYGRKVYASRYIKNSLPLWENLADWWMKNGSLFDLWIWIEPLYVVLSAIVVRSRTLTLRYRFSLPIHPKA